MDDDTGAVLVSVMISSRFGQKLKRDGRSADRPFPDRETYLVDLFHHPAVLWVCTRLYSTGTCRFLIIVHWYRCCTVAVGLSTVRNRRVAKTVFNKRQCGWISDNRLI